MRLSIFMILALFFFAIASEEEEHDNGCEEEEDEEDPVKPAPKPVSSYCSEPCKQHCDHNRFPFSCYQNCGCGDACAPSCRDLCMKTVPHEKPFKMCLIECGCQKPDWIMAVDINEYFPEGAENFEVKKTDVQIDKSSDTSTSTESEYSKGTTEFEDQEVKRVASQVQKDESVQSETNRTTFEDKLQGTSLTSDETQTDASAHVSDDSETQVVFRDNEIQKHTQTDTAKDTATTTAETSEKDVYKSKEKIETTGSSNKSTSSATTVQSDFKTTQTFLMKTKEQSQPSTSSENLQICMHSCMGTCNGSLNQCLDQCLVDCKSAFPDEWAQVKDKWGEMEAKMKQYWGTVSAETKKAWAKAAEEFQEFMNSSHGKEMQKGWEYASDASKQAWDMTKKKYQQFMNSSVGQEMQEKWELVKDEAKEKFQQAKQAAEKGFDKAKDAVEQGFDKAKDKVLDWWDSFTGSAQPQDSATQAISTGVHTLEIQQFQQPAPKKFRMSLMAYLSLIFLMMVVLGGAYVGALQYLFEKSRVYCQQEREKEHLVPESQVERYYKTL